MKKILKEKEPVGMLISQTSRNLLRFLALQLKEYEVTPEQWSVLKSLGSNDGVTQKELSQKTDKDQATLTRILDILERKLLIERRPNKEDRRSFLIHITESGKNLKEHLYPFIEGLYGKQLLNGISEENLNLLQRVLIQINENTKKVFSADKE
ncbi:transcriptional regulator, MarR family [Bacillus sp. OV322]|uniref:MarR family winged helix-turn-helix transcriptional regulator n=1 Tax=Bacillus sp. OV322 TaxID=1882764 RepID=UPI0008E923BD|nr:MarR family transcriptional regulator [Bacillus sp. OV322]SFC70069.1 transcriptional regulator, MarR family [Bacillus sp. OV322]